MLVIVQSRKRQHTVALPSPAGGAHWVCDAHRTRVALVAADGDAWTLSCDEGLHVSGHEHADGQTVRIDPACQTVLNVRGAGGQRWCLIFCPDDVLSKESVLYRLVDGCQVGIGRACDNAIAYVCDFVSSHHALLSYEHGTWSVADLNSANGVYVNGERMGAGENRVLAFGDTVSVIALRVTVGAGFVACNNPGGAVAVDTARLAVADAPDEHPEPACADMPQRPFFHPALRFVRSVEKKRLKIDAPPRPEAQDDTSLAMRIGPSALMALGTLVAAGSMIWMMGEQGASPLRVIPLAAMAVAMLAGSVAWPILNARHQKKRHEKKELQRVNAYARYLGEVRSVLAEYGELQREILEENRISVGECLRRARTRDARLMDRTPLHPDYLELRLGVGTEALVADVDFPTAQFSVEQDDLRDVVDQMAREPRVLEDVPLALSLVSKNVLGIAAADVRAAHAFARGLVAQVAALCSYDRVKVMVACDEATRAEWEFAAYLPHCFSDDKKSRFFACGYEEASELGMYLERVLAGRAGDSGFAAREALPYYVVVCASQDLIDRPGLVRSIAGLKANRGVSLVAVAAAPGNLPKECSSVVEIREGSALLVERDDASRSGRAFTPDIALSVPDARDLAAHLAALRLDLAAQKQHMPSRLGFFEMLGCGNAGQLNLAALWAEHSAAESLACNVGVDASGEPLVLNLHEKSHGPHGLIAGTTGSGKSEFIITWILSMAMTYSPDDVAFVLIDYKGGGLARAFENGQARLPHLAGVITNLDGAAIARSLVSIQSELKRRQVLFNAARDVAGGDNVDIYGYLDLFRQGKVSEPCPHLFIVADEFAELKDQQPEFMDELISAARIGRSLGVHLVLATQKPSGVVNDQIWSNARFKVCLKVADAADSREMIRRPDAAEIAEPGRFFLLVGYNEYFAVGQSAYSGARYVAKERFESAKDDSVTLISDTGAPVVSVADAKHDGAESGRSEAVVMLALIQDTARRLGVSARRLWLEPVAALVGVDGLRAKYGLPARKRNAHGLEAVVGEYDDPQSQRQGPLLLDLDEGNVLVYGTPSGGGELVVSALLYSLLQAHDARRLNAYILDFGSESLRAYASAPQVGDVICAGDEEKTTRFFDFIDAELSGRRRLFAPYGGSYERYAREHDDTAEIVVVVNECAAFLEARPDLEERLARLVRESGRCGMHLVMTAPSTSAVRMRMRQGFRQVLAVDLADASDYPLLFGSMKGVSCPSGFGRGLAKVGASLCEFQAAHVGDGSDEFSTIAAFCEKAAAQGDAEGAAAAPPVPTAPERVTPDMLLQYAADADFVPVGVFDSDLSVAGLDFSYSPIARCQFQRTKEGAAFAGALMEAQVQRAGWNTVLLDLAGICGFRPLDGLRFATRDEAAAKDFLAQVMEACPLSAGQPRLLVMMSGVADFLAHCGMDYETNVDFAALFKEFLRKLDARAGIRFLFVDCASASQYTFEEWYKAHLTAKDGLWVGPGIEGQTVLTVNYNAKLAPDSHMRTSKGYIVDGGDARLVHLAGIDIGGKEFAAKG